MPALRPTSRSECHWRFPCTALLLGIVAATLPVSPAPAADILEPDTPVVKVATDRGFTEGPVVDLAGQLFFSDSGRVIRRDTKGIVSLFNAPDGGVNGMMFDIKGRLHLCQNRGHRVSRLNPDGSLTVLATECDGFPLASPNDIAIDRKGRIFFTDTAFKHGEGDNRTSSGVLRIDPNGTCTLVVDNLRTPNGIIISPDERYIFVSDRGTQRLHRYLIQPDGSLQPDRVVYDFTPDRGIDGMCIDVQGNIYGAAGRDKTTGLFVISPNGELLLHHPLPDFATNATFGGDDLRDLYLTTTGNVYHFRTSNEGTATPLRKAKSPLKPLPGPAIWKRQTIMPSAAPASNDAELLNSIGMKLVRIKAGSFRMGSPLGETGRQADEEVHDVQIGNDFYLGAFEVTQAEYSKVIGRDRSHFSKNGTGRFLVAGQNTHRFPAERVSRDDALEFCKRLSALPQEKNASRAYRLPTEAEWEYASRAGRVAVYGVGDSLSGSQANFNGNSPYGDGEKGPFLNQPATAGSYKPNDWGLYDMHGNVWEWCGDAYQADYYRESAEKDPNGPSSGRLGVIRGGSWISAGSTCRSGNRHFYEPESRNGLIGFRIVCQ